MPEDQFFIDNELRLSCADAVELVTDHLDDALNERDRREFLAHLESCEGCRVYLDQITQTVRITSKSRADVTAQPENFAELLAEVERRGAPDDDHDSV
ncbi:zf-HC2 domain-containing protein [Actinospongicola halichondriae]|uniref:zf-HC2 domain-containing protein n=1 Tax=Actinospongicola halichondriae TaxID=3236844 RepID=UPI003D4DDAD7